MSLTQDENNAIFQIRACEPGKIQVNDKIYTRSIIISPNQLITDWPPQELSELLPHHFDAAAELEPAILLIGTGTHLQFPSIEMYGNLINQGIGVEIMDTRAACRTFNALSAEDRNVVAALIIR